MGQTITQHTTGSKMCHVHALAHIVYYILTAGGGESTKLCAVAKNWEWIPEEKFHIITTVRANAKILKLDLQAIDPNLVGAHSLRARGVMALNYMATMILT